MDSLIVAMKRERRKRKRTSAWRKSKSGLHLSQLRYVSHIGARETVKHVNLVSGGNNLTHITLLHIAIKRGSDKIMGSPRNQTTYNESKWFFTKTSRWSVTKKCNIHRFIGGNKENNKTNVIHKNESYEFSIGEVRPIFFSHKGNWKILVLVDTVVNQK